MKAKGSHGRRGAVIGEVLRYMIEHPDAKDTIEGILKWWLPEGRGEPRKEEVQEALNFLVSKGWLTKREISSEETVYGLNKKHLEEIKAFLEKS